MLKRQSGFGLILCLAFLCFELNSCKETTKEIESKTPYDSQEDDSFNLLKFKVKEEHFKKEGLKLKFNEVLLNVLSEGEYKLIIELDSLNSSLEAYTESYLVFSIYPKDDDIELLHSKRQKYKFESYSLKIASNKQGKLFASRIIKTKLNYARAITITILNYKTKEKSMEIILRDINF